MRKFGFIAIVVCGLAFAKDADRLGAQAQVEPVRLRAAEQPASPLQKSMAEEREESEYWTVFGHRLKITDSLLALFTAGLVGIGWWQGLQLRRTVDATKKAAEALPKIERAYLFLDSAVEQSRPVRLDVRARDGGEFDTADQDNIISTTEQGFEITFKNHGKTPAILNELFAEIRLCDKFGEATQARGTVFPPGEIVSASGTRKFPLEFSGDGTRYRAATDKGKPMLLLFGSINYKDVLNESRVTGFCWKYDFRLKRFSLSLDPEHNYWT